MHASLADSTAGRAQNDRVPESPVLASDSRGGV